MKKISLSILAVITVLISGCSEKVNEHGFVVNKDYELNPLTVVLNPLPESEQNDDIGGVLTEEVDVFSIDWEIYYENDVYSILFREIPEGMLFTTEGYVIGSVDENCHCVIGNSHMYRYVILYENKYFNFYEFHQKYNNLSCEFLDEININHSTLCER